MTHFSIDRQSTTPPFEQLKDQITDGRRSGSLPSGHRLPPVRRLAEELGVVPNTVARAYRELEKSGIVETRGRAGTFITPPDGLKHERARKAAQGYLTAARELGLGPEEAVRLVREEASTDR